MRSDLTSQGILFPVPIFSNHLDESSFSNESNGGQFKTISGIVDLLGSYGQTVFTTNFLNTPLNSTASLYDSAFAQNPFFGYLPQAIGILLAKILDLNTIWVLWLGRICNLALYDSIVAYAIKKTPILKVPFIFVACLPLAVIQSASVSIDSLVNSLALLVGQLSFIFNHIPESLVMLFGLPNYLQYCLSHIAVFGFPPFDYSSKFMSSIYPLFLGAIIFLYPHNNAISFRDRFAGLFVILFVFCGTYTIQLLTWTSVGDLYEIQGIQPRYFIPLLALAPFTFGVNNCTSSIKRIDKLIVVFAIGFLASALILTAITFYSFIFFIGVEYLPHFFQF